MQGNQNTFVGLDWLRFGLAFYIAVFHTAHLYPVVQSHAWLYHFTRLGNFATTGFLMLSGFLLTHAYIAKAGRFVHAPRIFFINRFAALYPLHLLTFLLAFALALTDMRAPGRILAPIPETANGYTVLPWSGVAINALLHLTLTHAWNPFHDVLFNGPSWSISALAFFYLLFPLVATPLFHYRRRKLALAVTGVLFVAPAVAAWRFGWNGTIAFEVLHHNPLARLPLFLAGIVLYGHFYFERKDTLLHTAAGKSCVAVMIVVALWVAAIYGEASTQSRFFVENGLYYLPALGMLWLAALSDRRWSERQRYWASRLGRASLSMFLIHLPLFHVIDSAEKFFAGIWGTSTRHDFGIAVIKAAARAYESPFAAYPLRLILIVIISVYLQEAVVNRLQHRIKRRFDTPAHRPSTVPGIAGSGGVHQTVPAEMDMERNPAPYFDIAPAPHSK
jgi:peptidoglycan/LPS O-acetylase OafA/YrhL